MNSLVANLSSAVLLLGSCLRAQEPPRAFQFTSADEKLLADANELDEQYEKKGLVYHDPEAEAYLNDIGHRLIGDDPPPEHVIYKFHILRDPMVNAFALPNGSIYVYTGLISAMEDDAELASVMSHEITHVVNRHTYIENRSLRKKAVTMDVIAIAAAASGYFPVGAVAGNTIAFAANFSQVFIIATVYGYSRELESEADTQGYARLIRADYDGEAMARALKLLDERLEFEPIEPFWRTHPKLEKRITTAQKLAEDENSLHPRVRSESQYMDHLASVIRYNIALDLDSRRARTAVARAQRLVNWDPNDAVNLTLLADAYRSLGAKTPKPTADELSQRGKEAVRRRMLKLTAEEEQQTLLATKTGKAALDANREEAGTLYREAVVLNPQLVTPHRGLGMLYQDEAKYEDAAREYRKYLDLAPPRAIDRLRIERRLEASISAAGEKK